MNSETTVQVPCATIVSNDHKLRLWWLIQTRIRTFPLDRNGSILIFSTELNAHTHMRRLGPNEDYFLRFVSWDELIDKFGTKFMTAEINFIEEYQRIVTIPLRLNE